ncbi:hypothetical protein [Tropicimonas sp. IMCC34043]|uniref:hypothetical protein n=1 Tax=Tropicimonas sp. IMCC34043 TaxID=2248760 RepID=UPI000E21C393|nr:hypothetical protein [Tropicimonas sp. IMCC34043]
MSKDRWHILREGPVLVLARHLPVRFDVSATTDLPAAGRARLAGQIRQDLWRALQAQRGFSPAVEVTAVASGLRVRAGGRVAAGRFDRAGLEARIAAVLEDPGNRVRWIRSAGGARP